MHFNTIRIEGVTNHLLHLLHNEYLKRRRTAPAHPQPSQERRDCPCFLQKQVRMMLQVAHTVNLTWTAQLDVHRRVKHAQYIHAESICIWPIYINQLFDQNPKISGKFSRASEDHWVVQNHPPCTVPRPLQYLRDITLDGVGTFLERTQHLIQCGCATVELAS
jgi:hypothetical protein